MTQTAKRTNVKRRAVGYVRRSTDRQEQSIPDQKQAIDAYAAEHGLRLGKFYVDDAISGTSTIGRRAFQQMMQDAQSPSRRFDLIIVYDVKRFGRVDNDEAGYYRHLLRTHGVDVRYVSENFNGDSTDDLLRPIKQWQARQESKDLSKVTIRGLLSKMDGKTQGNGQGGWWMGGVPPHGYDLRYETVDGDFLFVVRYLPDGCKRILDEKGGLTRTLARGESLNISKRDRAKLVPSSPERVQVIKLIFRMYTEQGKGFKSVAESLNLDEIPTPRGPAWSHIYTGQWTDTTIRSILINPVYVGDMVWNRRTDARFYQIRDGRAVERESVHGARLVPNNESDWIVVRDAHPALISRRVFEQARQRRESHLSSIEQRGKNPRVRLNGGTGNGQRSRFILSGLLTCSLCGNRYQGVTRNKGRKRVDGSNIATRYYGCGGHITKGKKICEMNPIPQSELETLVIDAVLDFYRPYLAKGGRRKVAETVKQQAGSESEHFETARARTEEDRQRVTQIINNLLDNITPANRDLVDHRLEELTLQQRELETRLDELDQLATSKAEMVAIVADAMQFLGGLEFTLRQGLPQEKLVALRQCIERIHISKPESEIQVRIKTVPAGSLQGTETIKRDLGTTSPATEVA
ncbi:MAG: recombinase family protein [Phycisphaerales bacterium]|nr:MAG: recombinase family protein [Phycisphaerales bacterium]